MATVLDYSAGRPTAAQVKAAGHAGVIRYIGLPGNPKCLTAAEYLDMDTAGLGVALVYERAAGDALAGRAAGRAAATAAVAHARAVGWPADRRPIYYACDTDVVTEAQFAAVLDYLRGAGEIHGGPARVGVYGEYDVVERAAAAGVASWWWQTRAWSAGRLSARAQLRQEIGQIVVGGIQCDRNTVLAADWGQHTVGGGDGMPTAEELARALWAAEYPWPGNYAGLPHTDETPSAQSMLWGAAVRAYAAELNTKALQSQVTAVAAALAAVSAKVAALSDDETRILQAVAAGDAQVVAAVAASNGPVLAAIEAAVARVAEQTPPDPGDPGGREAFARAVVAEFTATLERGQPGVGGSG